MSHLVLNEQSHLSHNDSANYLVAVENGRSDLPEKASCLSFRKASLFADVIVELTTVGIFHDEDDLVLVLEHLVDLDAKMEAELAQVSLLLAMLPVRIVRSDHLHVRVTEHRHNADFASNANQVLLVLDGALLNELHCYLQMFVFIVGPYYSLPHLSLLLVIESQ